MELTQRDRVIEQAMHMFASQGIKSVRMDDIASRLGMSKRTLYEMFESKDELLFLAMTYYFDQQHKRSEERCSETENVLEALFLEMDCMLDGAQESTRMMENLRKFYPAIYTRLMTEGQQKYRQEFQKMLERGVAEGLFISNVSIDLAISMLYHTATALVAPPPTGLLLPEGVTEQMACMQVLQCFFRGIATAEGLRLIDLYRAEHPYKDL